MVAGELGAEAADLRVVRGEAAQREGVGELRGGVVAGAQFLAAPVERDAPVDASEARTFLARDVGEGASVVGVAGERA